MIFSIILQFVVISTSSMLSVLLYLFVAQHGTSEAGDKLFPAITTGPYLPMIVGILFIVGLASPAYNAAGAVPTALTISFIIDTLGGHLLSENRVKRMWQRVHLGTVILMRVATIATNTLNSTSVVDAVYTLASHTYGFLLGTFAFGTITKQQVYGHYVSWVAIAAPVLCLILDKHSMQWLNGYQSSYEILTFNALFTFLGPCLSIRRR